MVKLKVAVSVNTLITQDSAGKTSQRNKTGSGDGANCTDTKHISEIV